MTDNSESWVDDIQWDPIVTAARPEYFKMVRDWGFLAGCRLDEVERQERHGYKVDFLDLHWENPDNDSLLNKCKKHRPAYVVAGDFSSTGDNISQVIEFGDELLKYSENVIIVPHTKNQIEKIGDRFIVGYSMKSSYNSTTASDIEYQGRDIHLLGGSPMRQLRKIRKFGSDVVSFDSNYILNMAYKYSRYWRPVAEDKVRPNFVALEKFQFFDGENHVEAFTRSLMNWGYFLRSEPYGQARDVLDF